MNEQDQPNQSDPAFPLDVLIGRIIDGEASEDQRRRFESLAAADGDLWRRLALRQQDTAMLAAHVEPTLNRAEAIELPAPVSGHAPLAFPASRGDTSHESAAAVVGAGAARWPWWMAASGWAAVIALAAVWASTVMSGHSRMQEGGTSTLQTDARRASVSPEEHLQHYMQAPFVMGDMPPTLLQVDQLSDGRFAVSYLRRIVEVKYYDAADQIPLDSDGNLSDSPRELRKQPSSEAAPTKPRD